MVTTQKSSSLFVLKLIIMISGNQNKYQLLAVFI
jgi:hypothetical protein